MKECEKKSPLKCLNCKQEECDMKKITMILEKLNLLKEVNKEIKQQFYLDWRVLYDEDRSGKNLKKKRIFIERI